VIKDRLIGILQQACYIYGSDFCLDLDLVYLFQFRVVCPAKDSSDEFHHVFYRV